MNPCGIVVLASMVICALAGGHGGIAYGGGGGFGGGHGWEGAGIQLGHGGGHAIHAPISIGHGHGGGFGGFGKGIALGHGGGHGYGGGYGGGFHQSLVHGPVKVKGDIHSAKKYAHLAYGHGW